MIDVLVFLFENYFDISTHPESDALARKLSAAGFDPDEVSFALDWLNELKLARRCNFQPTHVPSASTPTRSASGSLTVVSTSWPSSKRRV